MIPLSSIVQISLNLTKIFLENMMHMKESQGLTHWSTGDNDPMYKQWDEQVLKIVSITRSRSHISISSKHVRCKGQILCHQ